MNKRQILDVIRDELSRIAPDIDFDSVDQTRSIQQQFDIDSMDFLNFITALHERLDVNVPESDYEKVATISTAHAYLADKMGAPP